MPDQATSESSVAAGAVIELPSLGADMEQGTLLEWYVAPGDRVERGSIVALVSTEKADVDVEIWQAGTVAELLVELGVDLPVGTPILRLAADDEPPSEPALALPSTHSTTLSGPPPTETPKAHPPATAPATPTPRAAPVPSNDAPSTVAASPFARAAAEKAGIDLGAVTGSGPNGAVLARDVQAHLSVIVDGVKEAAKPRPDRAKSMRRAIATRMAAANRDIPHYYLQHDVDMGPSLAWLEKRNATRSIAERVLPAALLLKASAAAAAAMPALNGFWIDDRFHAAKSVDLAVVISLRGGGLVTPKIADADQLDLEGVMAALTTLVTNARRGTLRSSWLSQTGLTVSSLGDRGVDRLDGVIFPPQVALIGFGGIRPRPWVIDDTVVARPVVTISLAADHRASDGAIGSRFLSLIAEFLEHPEEP